MVPLRSLHTCSVRLMISLSIAVQQVCLWNCVSGKREWIKWIWGWIRLSRIWPLHRPWCRIEETRGLADDLVACTGRTRCHLYTIWPSRGHHCWGHNGILIGRCCPSPYDLALAIQSAECHPWILKGKERDKFMNRVFSRKPLPSLGCRSTSP